MFPTHSIHIELILSALKFDEKIYAYRTGGFSDRLLIWLTFLDQPRPIHSLSHSAGYRVA